jgi:hypothetical protein
VGKRVYPTGYKQDKCGGKCTRSGAKVGSKTGPKSEVGGDFVPFKGIKYYNILCKIIDNLYPVKAPRAEGIGNTINLPRSVTYLGRLTILPIKK